MEAPRPRAGPLIATTMGFLNWMKAFTKSLGEKRRPSLTGDQACPDLFDTLEPTEAATGFPGAVWHPPVIRGKRVPGKGHIPLDTKPLSCSHRHGTRGGQWQVFRKKFMGGDCLSPFAQMVPGHACCPSIALTPRIFTTCKYPKEANLNVKFRTSKRTKRRPI